MLQAPMLDGLSFDPFTLFDDGSGPAGVGVGGRDVVQTLMVALMVIMLDERFDLAFQIAGQEVIFEEDTVLQSLVPALDLTLRLRMQRCAAHMAHLVGFDIVGKLARNVAGAIIAEQPGLVLNRGAVTA